MESEKTVRIDFTKQCLRDALDRFLLKYYGVNLTNEMFAVFGMEYIKAQLEQRGKYTS